MSGIYGPGPAISAVAAVWAALPVQLAIGLAAAIVLIILLVRALWEPTSLECQTIQVVLAEPAPELAVRPLRLLLFSDLHAEYFRVRRDRFLAACAEARPDVILFAGDLAGHATHLTAALDLMRQIRLLPELQDCPFLAVRGNHDTPEAASGLVEIGITVLENDCLAVSIRGQSWLFMGFPDLQAGNTDISGVLHQAEATGIPPERRLALAHNPDTLLCLPAGTIAFFLAGHFHGGQIWLPFHLEFYLLRSEKLARVGYFKGRFTWQGTPAYISRGLGCVSMPLRLFSRPELTLIEIS